MRQGENVGKMRQMRWGLCVPQMVRWLGVWVVGWFVRKKPTVTRSSHASYPNT